MYRYTSIRRGDGEIVTLPTLAADPAELDWQDRALCAEVDPELFFPTVGESPRLAKQVCMRCEVRSDCLEYALQHNERFGVWGGKSERERQALRSARRNDREAA